MFDSAKIGLGTSLLYLTSGPNLSLSFGRGLLCSSDRGSSSRYRDARYCILSIYIIGRLARDNLKLTDSHSGVYKARRIGVHRLQHNSTPIAFAAELETKLRSGRRSRHPTTLAGYTDCSRNLFQDTCPGDQDGARIDHSKDTARQELHQLQFDSRAYIEPF